MISAVVLTSYDESSETQNNTSKIENDVSKTTSEINEPIKLTGTPADRYPPNEQDQHCGKSDAKSNSYIKEFEIPTPCSQPLSIITDSEGKVWFIQTNTGNLTMFDPESNKFTEYQNDLWALQKVSMMWGIAYTQDDDEIWFTDEVNDFLWKFSIKDKNYSKIDFPGKKETSFPQKIEYHDGYFLINDFTGNQIIIVSHENLHKDKVEYSSISVPEGYFTSQTSSDNNGNFWFVMWKYQAESILTRINLSTQETERFSLPPSINAPNGVSVGPSGKIWIADTAGSSFYSFNPENIQVSEFVTSDPPISTYGNASGLIKTPITRPYWNDFDSDGNMWFNQQTANRLAMFDPTSESLIEYDIPSKNPKWSDCGELSDCGTSQSFGFTFQNEQVWFTEWVENNIGVLDTSITVPISLDLEQDSIEIKPGEQEEISVTVVPKTNQRMDIVLTGNTGDDLIKINTKNDPMFISDKTLQIPVIISVDEKTQPGQYKVLFSIQLLDVSVSSYATINVV